MPLKHKTSGKLISFEGSEGSGKSTQIARLAAHFQKTQREVLTTREPGGTEIGEQIRNIIVHNSKGDEMCAETELLLFTAARAQLVRERAPASPRATLKHKHAEATRPQRPGCSNARRACANHGDVDL